jgi:hypothetical protein
LVMVLKQGGFGLMTKRMYTTAVMSSNIKMMVCLFNNKKLKFKHATFLLFNFMGYQFWIFGTKLQFNTSIKFIELSVYFSLVPERCVALLELIRWA